MVCLVALRAEAAMVRVVAIENGRTIAIERNGVRESIRLAGVEITDEARARELLRWTAGDAWVMLEEVGKNEFLAYRSPDALFLNRELVLRGYARATLRDVSPEMRAPSRYLGEFHPVGPQQQAAPKAKVSEKGPSKTSSGTGRRSSKTRKPRGRSSARNP